VKEQLKTLFRPLVVAVRNRLPKVDSRQYWERRYRAGLSSGSGSYGRLARFKADVINNLVARENVKSVIEFGSGDGGQLELAEYPDYLGVDVSETAVRHCARKFADRPNYRFVTLHDFDPMTRAELTLSLDVIYHLVEDRFFAEHMAQLFDSSERFVVIYSSNEEALDAVPHVRHRRFADWVSLNRPDFALDRHIPNPYPFDPNDPDNTSHADFYIYRRLAKLPA